MKKILIDAPLEYVAGHLRYGHLEGVIEVPDEEFEKFKKNPRKLFIQRVKFAGISYRWKKLLS